MSARPCRLLGGALCCATLCASCATAPGERIAPAPDPRLVQPERPTVATHAGTVAPAFVEVETGIEADRLDEDRRAVIVPTVVKLGLAPRLQLNAQLPLLGGTGLTLGAGDMSVGVKWRLTDDHPVLARVAVLPSVKLSTGGQRGSGTTDVGLLLIDSRSIGPVGVDLNVGVVRRAGTTGDQPRTLTLWTIAGGAPIFHAIGWQLELFGYPGAGGQGGAPPTAALLTGPTFAAHRALSFDAGIIAPLHGPQPRALYAGLVANLGRWLP